MIWYREENDIVVSTRIRLARNLANLPFPNMMTDQQKKTAAEQVKNAVIGGNSALAPMFRFTELEKLSDADKQALVEEHMISPEMTEGGGRFLLQSEDDTMSIMLMEEDHIRLQIIRGGLCLDEAWETADKVDDVIEENASYAFDSEFGYLTSCPTNTGTGLRASVMMHLPALVMTGNISKIISSAGGLGIAVRGLYGEGSKSYGNLYQFSNQITMGSSETEIIARLKNIIQQIVELEQQARKSLMENEKIALEDKVCRSMGLLRYARTMTSGEAKSLLSDVMLGMDMGIIKTDVSPIELMILSEPAHIMRAAGKNLPPAERDIKRAEILREKMGR